MVATVPRDCDTRHFKLLVDYALVQQFHQSKKLTGLQLSYIMTNASQAHAAEDALWVHQRHRSIVGAVTGVSFLNCAQLYHVFVSLSRWCIHTHVNYLCEATLMSFEQLLHEKRAEIEQIAARHGVIRVRVFGSAARGEATVESDLDFLVQTGPVTSPWFPAGLILDLEALLGRRVEIVTEHALRPELRESVLHDARPL
jgi:uncharacterized protein